MRKWILNNFWLKLLSILAAIITWVVIVNYDNPNMTRVISGKMVTPRGYRLD